MEGPIHAADEAFRLAFERGEIPNDAFHHRDHLSLAWIYLRELEPDAAAVRVTDGIRRYAEYHAAGARYHETLSRAWVRIVALAVAETPGAGAFDELLSLRPHLLDKKLPLKHYSAATLWGKIARERWIEPDLQPFPA